MAYTPGPQLYDPTSIASFANNITARAGGSRAAAVALLAATYACVSCSHRRLHIRCGSQRQDLETHQMTIANDIIFLSL